MMGIRERPGNFKYSNAVFVKHNDEEGVVITQESRVHNECGVYYHTEVKCVYLWDDGTKLEFPRDDFCSLVRVG